MKFSEILAPAGSMESLVSAVNSGADAVYMGCGALNARRNAQNFTPETFAQGVAYCKARGVKVYMTLNTVVYDRELESVKEGLRLACACGVTAVLVQDMAAVALAKQLCPTLPLHCSTQMTIHNLSGAVMAKELGFTRVVLARELTKEEIGLITKQSGVPTEVFVHGALCMSVSGQCYMSSVIGEHSGNRGLCAGTCRMPFSADKPDAKGESFALSLKDASLIPQLDALQEMGVASLKIEGRMKRPEYVAAAVTACRKALAHQEVDYHTLQSVFSRSGFTAGFFDGKRDARMFGVRSKEDVTAAASVLSTLANEAQKEYPRIPVDFSLTLQAGKPISLTATDGTHTTTVCGEPPALAQNKPTDAALVEKALRKLGGTFYLFGALHCTLEEGLMVPVSVLNDLRRRALQQLTDLRGALVPYPFDVPHVERTPIESKFSVKTTPRLRVICTNKEQISTIMLEQCEYVALPMEEALTLEVTDALRQKLMLTLPRVCFGDDISKLTPALTTLRERGICHLAVGHLGDVHLGKSLGFTLHGGCGLNITNAPALAAYAALGLCDSLLSFELNFPRARAITPTIPKGILAYGYLPLMVTRTCPVGGKCATCNHKRQLIDRRGASFGILCTSSYCEILNGVPLYLADKPDEAAAFSFLSLLFTTETPAQCQDIFTQYATSHLPQQNTTRGLYTRNVL